MSNGRNEERSDRLSGPELLLLGTFGAMSPYNLWLTCSVFPGWGFAEVAGLASGSLKLGTGDRSPRTGHCGLPKVNH